MLRPKQTAATLALALAMASPAAADNATANKALGAAGKAQSALEAAGVVKRSVPMGAALGVLAAPLCFEVVRGPVGAIDGSGIFRGVCSVMIPFGLVTYALLPLIPYEAPEPSGATVHHVDVSAYLLDFNTKSALTGSVARAPVGGLFGNMGYDFGYTYIHPTNGALA